MARLFVYHLEHRMSAPSCNGECGAGSQHTPPRAPGLP
nr:c-mos gene [Mus musculus]